METRCALVVVFVCGEVMTSPLVIMRCVGVESCALQMLARRVDVLNKRNYNVIRRTVLCVVLMTLVSTSKANVVHCAMKTSRRSMNVFTTHSLIRRENVGMMARVRIAHVGTLCIRFCTCKEDFS